VDEPGVSESGTRTVPYLGLDAGVESGAGAESDARPEPEAGVEPDARVVVSNTGREGEEDVDWPAVAVTVSVMLAEAACTGVLSMTELCTWSIFLSKGEAEGDSAVR
jgi:hypothetical protein